MTRRLSPVVAAHWHTDDYELPAQFRRRDTPVLPMEPPRWPVRWQEQPSEPRMPARAGVRTQEQHVARLLYYAMARATGVEHPPAFSSLKTQDMWLSMANEVLGYVQAVIEG